MPYKNGKVDMAGYGASTKKKAIKIRLAKMKARKKKGGKR